MSQSFKFYLLLPILIGVFLSSGPSQAKENKIHLKNCSKSAYFTVYFFNGPDDVRAIPYVAVKLKPGQTGTGKCAKTLWNDSSCTFKFENTKKGKLGHDIWSAIKTLGAKYKSAKNNQWITIKPKSAKIVFVNDSEQDCS